MNAAEPHTSTKEYEEFLSSPLSRQWQKTGTRRRAGVCVPLFSLHSAQSLGVGEYPDLTRLADWCAQTGLSLIQLLPLNDVGFDFRPYDGQSSFALEPLYLNVEQIEGVDPKPYRAKIEELRKNFPLSRPRVDYGIKRAKLALLRAMFDACGGKFPEAFGKFAESQRYWLEDYALFRVIKDKHPGSWESWPEEYRQRHEGVLARLRGEEKEGLRFYEWLQWQCCEQFRKAKAHALGKGVLILGDLPLLVSRDSADVWARQNYFKLDRVSGAPPDLYIAEGQRWGMPPYNWEEIAAHGHEYTIQKVRYAQNFYDLFRIDHVVGLFRLWTIAVHEPLQNAGKYGVFDPQNEALWEEHGKKIIDVMVSNTDMLPCAEDLGVVPECSYKTLREYAMPGMDVQRWTRHWESQGEFKAPSEYRKNSLALMSTHDMSIFLGWWNYEVGTADEGLFDNMCRTHHMDPAAMKQKLFEPPVYGRLRWKKEISSPDALAYALERPHDHIRAFLDLHRLSFHEKEQFLGYLGCRETPPVREFVRKSLEKASESRAVFCIQLIHDWLSLGDYFDADPWHARINFPGTVNDGNWSFRSPVSLEALQALEGINKQILEINKKTVRI